LARSRRYRWWISTFLHVDARQKMCEIALLISRSLRNWRYESWNVRNAKVVVFLVQNPDGTSRPSIFKKNMHRDRVYKVQPCHERIIHRSALQVRLPPKKRTCSWNGRNIMGESENPKIMPCISNKCRTSHHVGTLFRCYFLVDACRLEAWPFVMPGCSSFVADALSALSLWCRTNVLFPEHILFVKNTTRS